MGNNKDLTNINVVINSEVAKDILEKDHVKEKVSSCGDLRHCMVSNKDLTNRNKIVNPEAAKDILENNQKGNNTKANTTRKGKCNKESTKTKGKGNNHMH